MRLKPDIAAEINAKVRHQAFRRAAWAAKTETDAKVRAKKRFEIPQPDSKVCGACGYHLPIDAYHLRSKKSNMRSSRCKFCTADALARLRLAQRRENAKVREEPLPPRLMDAILKSAEEGRAQRAAGRARAASRVGRA